MLRVDRGYGSDDNIQKLSNKVMFVAEAYSAVEMFHFYNKRQSIEAFFKSCKNIYNIKNLRTRKFDGIRAFL